MKRSRSFMDFQYKAVLEAAERGDGKAKTKLAWFLLSGLGGASVDADKAVIMLEAMWILGVCREYGIGVEQNIEKALYLYEESHRRGNRIGHFLGTVRHHKKGCGYLALDQC